jgi:hypothetical protein
MATKTKLFFPELGMEVDVDVNKLAQARANDRRGYATFNALDAEGEEVAIPGSEGNAVCVSILLNDKTVKSKGSGKKQKKMLTASKS